MTFSKRYGFDSKTIPQKEDMNKDLRVAIWNVIYENEIEVFCNRKLIEAVVKKIYKEEIDLFTSKSKDRKIELFKRNFMEIEWNKIYDIIEFTVYYSEYKYIINKFNKVLIEENSAYRIMDEGSVVPIVDDVEINEINEVLNCKYDVVKNQIKDALILLSDRKNPNYKDSFKNSISAVESLCKIILKNENISLGQALKQIEKDQKIKLNGTLKKGYSILYGFASNETRHGTIKEPEIDYDLAKYMVVSCSAFINYLISKM